MDGFMIAVEGIDGVGKKTQCDMLAEALRRKGREVLSISFPDYASPYGAIIKQHLEGKRELGVEELFHTYMTDMIRHREPIEESIKKGNDVVVNRWRASTVAYESAVGFNYEKAIIIQNAVALPTPDLSVFFDVLPLVSMARKEVQRNAEGEAKDRFESSGAIQNGADYYYRKMIAQGWGAKRWARVPADGSKEEIHARVMREVEPLILNVRNRV